MPDRPGIRQKAAVVWTVRVLLWATFFFLFFIALDLWKLTGIYTLERTLSRVLQGDVDIQGLKLDWPVGIRLQKFQVDSVLVVHHARIQWRPFLRLRRVEILSAYVDLDTWLPRFWVPTTGPPRAPLFPPLAVDAFRAEEVRVRVGGITYRASGVRGKLRMGQHHMEIPFTLTTLTLPFRGRYFQVRGVYDLDYPANLARHRIRNLEGLGVDTLRGGSLRFYRDTLHIRLPRLYLRDVGRLHGVSGWLIPRKRHGFLRIARAVLPSWTVHNLSARYSLDASYRNLQIHRGRAYVEDLVRLRDVTGRVHLLPPYPFIFEGQADSLTRPNLLLWGAFRVEGTQTPPYAFHFQAHRGTLGPTPVESLTVRGVYTPESTRVDTFRWATPWGNVQFHGTLFPDGPEGTATLQAQDLPQALREWTPLEVEAGEGWARITFQRGGGFQGEAFAQYVEDEEFLLSSLHADFRNQDTTREIQLNIVGVHHRDSLLLDSLRLYAFLHGKAPPTPCPWDTLRAWPPGSWFMGLYGTSWHAELSGIARGTWPCIQFVASAVEAAPLTPTHPAFTGVLTSDRFSFYLSGLLPLGRLTGEVVFSSGSYWMDAALRDFPLAALVPLAQRPLRGTFSGQIHLVGTPRELEMTGSGIGEDFQMEALRADRFQTAFRYRKPSLILDSLVLEDPGGTIHVTGQIFAEPPYFLNLAAHLQGGGTALLNELLQDLLIAERMEGYGEIRIQGVMESPLLSGEMAVMGRNVLLVGTGTSLDSVAVLIQTREDTLQVSQIWGVAQGGTVEGEGWTRVVALEPRETWMALRVDRLPVEPSPLIYARVSGDLRVDGVLPVLWVRGNLRMDEAYIDARFGKLGGPQRAPQPSPLRMDLHLTAPSGVFLINELADVEFSADLQVYKPDDINMYLQGELEALSGTFLYLDRIFDIQEGQIRFQNDPEFNPQLFLVGQTLVDTYTVYLTVTGYLQEPLFSLRSVPPLDTLSILSLLTLGTPRPTDLRQVAELSYLQNRVFSLAGALLASRFRTQIGLRELAWQPTGEFVIGAMIGRNLYIRSWGDPRDFQNFSSRIEYYLSPNRRSSVYFERSGEGRISLGLQYEWNF